MKAPIPKPTYENAGANRTRLRERRNIARAILAGSVTGETLVAEDGSIDWEPPVGGVGALNSGVVEVNFGAHPGTDIATVAVTGQTTIAADSKITVWIFPKDTTDHTAEEHLIEDIRVFVPVASIIVGTGFTVHAVAESGRAHGLWNVGWMWG